MAGTKARFAHFELAPERAAGESLRLLWVDRVEHLTQAEVWLELQAGNLAAASEHLKKHAVTRCDEIEPLPDGLHAFWIKNPASVVHLVTEQR